MRYVKRLNLISDGIYEPPISKGKMRYKNGKIANVKILWDTGCTNTTISKSVADYIETKIVTENIEVEGVNGKSIEGTCYADLSLYTDNGIHIFTINNAKVCVADDMNMDVLLGMDIISKGDFSLTKNLEYLTLEFSF